MIKHFFLLTAFLTIFDTAYAKQHRSYEAKAEFKRLYHCPATDKAKGPCPGYIVDHIKPLACGGSDDYTNMQWQTIDEAKAKDKWERLDC